MNSYKMIFFFFLVSFHVYSSFPTGIQTPLGPGTAWSGHHLVRDIFHFYNPLGPRTGSGVRIPDSQFYETDQMKF